MKTSKKLLLIASFLFFNIISSQIKFEKAYIIKNNGETISCLIKNMGWKNTPTSLKYKLSDKDSILNIDINEIKEFGINNKLKYIKNFVDRYDYTDNIEKMDFKKNPIFYKDTLLLKVLIEGDATLYKYANADTNLYFFKKGSGPVQPLIYKLYKKYSNKVDIAGRYVLVVAKNETFKQQLLIALKCKELKTGDFKSLKYTQNDLIKIFIKYNKCKNPLFTSQEKKYKRYKLRIRPGIAQASISIENSLYFNKNADLDKKIIPQYGMEFEFILPYNNNKWSLLVEPAYKRLKAHQIRNSDIVLGNILYEDINYTSFDISSGVRYYFFLNNQSKIFINFSYVIDLSPTSEIIYRRSDSTLYKTYETNKNNNWALGAGFDYKKLSLEIRWNTSRNILSSYSTWSSDFNSLAIIIGYNIL